MARLDDGCKRPGSSASTCQFPVQKSFYPTQDMFICVKCRGKKFGSWREYENHHTKHAVEYAFAKFPVVKMKRISFEPTPLPPASRSQSSCSSSVQLPEPEIEELQTCPESCETSSPSTSPAPPQTEPVASPTISPDSSILDPAFVERLGEEISFLNQSIPEPVTKKVSLLPESVKNSAKSQVQDQISTIPANQPEDNVAPKVNVSTPDVEVIEDVSSEPTSLSVSPVESNTEKEEAKTAEAELPKSKGQLRLVPFESLLSPSFVHVDAEEEVNQPDKVASSSLVDNQNPRQAMVAIPEKNLEDLHLLNRPTISKPTILSGELNKQDGMLLPADKSHQVQPPQPNTVQVYPYQTNHTGQNQQQHRQSLPLGAMQSLQQMVPYQHQQQQPLQQHQYHQGFHGVNLSRSVQQPLQDRQNTLPQQAHQQNHQLQQQHQQIRTAQIQQQQHQQQQQIQQQHQQQQQIQQQHQQQQQIQQQHQQQQQIQQQHQQQQQIQQYSNFAAQPRLQYPQTYSANNRPIQTVGALGSATGYVSNRFPTTAACCPPSNSTTSVSGSGGQFPTPTQFNATNSLANSGPVGMVNPNAVQNRPTTQLTSVQHVQLQTAVQHAQLQSAISNSVREANTQPTPQQQSAIQNAHLVRQTSTSSESHRVQNPPTTFVVVRPQAPPSALVSTSRPPLPPVQTVPIRSTHPVSSNPSIIRLTPAPPPSGQAIRQATAIRLVAPNQKRPNASAETGPAANQPPPKVARIVERGMPLPQTTVPSKTNRDCEVLIVQKKQTGLPIIQSVEGSGVGGSCSVSGGVVRPNVQSVTPTSSVVSLMSNPNITITSKNKDALSALESNPQKQNPASTVASTTITGKSSGPLTIDLTSESMNSASLLSTQPNWSKNPLTCQVCNETFDSQSLLKTHLVLHLKRTLKTTTTPGPSMKPTVYRTATTKTTSQTVQVPTKTNVVDPNRKSSSSNVKSPNPTGPVSKQNESQSNPATRTTDSEPYKSNEKETNHLADKGASRISSAAVQAQQPSSAEEPESAVNDNLTSQFFIPIFDLRQENVLSQLESLGVTQFIAASNIRSGAKMDFVVPILSGDILKNKSRSGLPFAGGINIGKATNPTKPKETS